MIISDEEPEEESTAVRKNHIRRSDMRCITNGQWLSDVVINAAQLMKEDKDLLPIGGLYSVGPNIGTAISI